MDINIKHTWDIYHRIQPQYDSLGLHYENSNTAVKYFCTPKGANIFASMGVGGVHFCTISKHGETIFTVSPDTSSERYVFPVANNIDEFFQIVFTLLGTQLIDQIPMFSKEQFEIIQGEHIKKNSNFISKDAIDFANKFGIIDNKISVYDTVMGLYNGFNYSTIKYTPLYYDTLGISEK